MLPVRYQNLSDVDQSAIRFSVVENVRGLVGRLRSRGIGGNVLACFYTASSDLARMKFSIFQLGDRSLSEDSARDQIVSAIRRARHGEEIAAGGFRGANELTDGTEDFTLFSVVEILDVTGEDEETGLSFVENGNVRQIPGTLCSVQFDVFSYALLAVSATSDEVMGPVIDATMSTDPILLLGNVAQLERTTTLDETTKRALSDVGKTVATSEMRPEAMIYHSLTAELATLPNQ